MNEFLLVAESSDEALYLKCDEYGNEGVYRLPKSRWNGPDIDMGDIAKAFEEGRVKLFEFDPVANAKTLAPHAEFVSERDKGDALKTTIDAAWNDVLHNPNFTVLCSSEKEEYSLDAYLYFANDMPDCAARSRRIGRAFEIGICDMGSDLDLAEAWYKKAESQGSVDAKYDLERIKAVEVEVPKCAVVRYEAPDAEDCQRGKVFVAVPSDYVSCEKSKNGAAFIVIQTSEDIDLTGDRVKIPVRDIERLPVYTEMSLLDIDERDQYYCRTFNAFESSNSAALKEITDERYREVSKIAQRERKKRVKAEVSSSCLKIKSDDPDVYSVRLKTAPEYKEYNNVEFDIASRDVKLSDDLMTAELSLPFGAEFKNFKGVTANKVAKRYPVKDKEGK